MWFAVSFFHLISSLLIMFVFGMVTGFDIDNGVYWMIAIISIGLSAANLVTIKLKGGKKDE